MARELKVGGGCVTGLDRTIVATRTKKRAIELLNISAHHFNRYCCETSNKKELEVTLNNPEVVYTRNNNSNKDDTYREVM